MDGGWMIMASYGLKVGLKDGLKDGLKVQVWPSLTLAGGLRPPDHPPGGLRPLEPPEVWPS